MSASGPIAGDRPRMGSGKPALLPTDVKEVVTLLVPGGESQVADELRLLARFGEAFSLPILGAYYLEDKVSENCRVLNPEGRGGMEAHRSLAAWTF
jgi:hypothetical protein